MLTDNSFNVAEVIPYKTSKEQLEIIQQELNKNRSIEIWDKFIYSAEKWELVQ